MRNKTSHYMKFKDQINDKEKTKWWNKELRDCAHCYKIPMYNLDLPLAYRRMPQVCVDVGANVGSFSYYAAPHFKNVYAFEAVQSTFETARDNLQNASNVELYNLAAYNVDDKDVTITEHTSGLSGDSSIYANNNNESLQSESCKTISLEGIFDLCDIDFIDYLKVDCEGAEYDLLYNKDLSQINFMVMELHPGYLGESKTSELLQHIEKYFDLKFAVGEHIYFFHGKGYI